MGEKEEAKKEEKKWEKEQGRDGGKRESKEERQGKSKLLLANECVVSIYWTPTTWWRPDASHNVITYFW